MRAMLISNLDVDQRFANGTQGRLLNWHPGATESKRTQTCVIFIFKIHYKLYCINVIARRALPAYCPDLLARFCKESSLTKQQMLPDIDMIDIVARQENLAIKGEPIMFQLCVVPCYALTIHKTQALSIKHIVVGCLEGNSGDKINKTKVNHMRSYIILFEPSLVR